MSLPGFAAWSALGTIAWTTVLTVAGYLLGQRYTEVERYVGPVSTKYRVACTLVCLEGGALGSQGLSNGLLADASRSRARTMGKHKHA